MYNKQEWKDEIPDLTKPIMDPSTGKQKTDQQTGRPLFELVQEGTRITSSRLNTMEDGIEAAHGLVEILIKEMGGNFVATSNGIRGLACTTQGLKVKWTAGVAYVNGLRYEVDAGETDLTPTKGQYVYVDTDGVVKVATNVKVVHKGLVIFYVSTDTSGVISSEDRRINLNMEELRKRIESVESDIITKTNTAERNSKTYTDQRVGALNDLKTNAKGNTVLAINELFQSVSNGKELLANAITDMGQPTLATDPFQVMDEHIRNLSTTTYLKEFSATTVGMDLPTTLNTVTLFMGRYIGVLGSFSPMLVYSDNGFVWEPCNIVVPAGVNIVQVNGIVRGEGSGVFIGICNAKHLIRSADGINWEYVYTPDTTGVSNWTDIAYGGGPTTGRMFCVSDGKSTMVSIDGFNWEFHLNSIANSVSTTGAVPERLSGGDTANSKFLMVYAASVSNNGIITSNDGINWTQATFPGGNLPKVITRSRFGPHGWIVMGVEQLARTVDGSTWEIIDLPAGLFRSVDEVAYFAGRYIAVGQANNASGLQRGAIFSSPDGVTWERIFISNGPPLLGGFRTLAGNDEGAIFYSTTTSLNVYSGKIDPGKPFSAARLRERDIRTNVAAALAAQSVPTSASIARELLLENVARIPKNKLGIDWTHRQTIAPAVLVRAGTMVKGSFIAVCALANGASSGNALFSANGTQISTVATPKVDCTDIAHNNAGMIVAVGQAANGSTNAAMYSTNGGLTWTAVPTAQLAASLTFAAIQWNGSRFIAVTTDARVYSSSNGTTWQSDVFWMGFRTGTIIDSCMTPWGMYIMTAYNVLFTADYQTYDTVLTFDNSCLRAMAFGDGKLVIVTNALTTVYDGQGNLDMTKRGEVISTTNGVNWTYSNLGNNNAGFSAGVKQFQDVTYDRGLFIATLSGTAPAIALSADGVNWIGRNRPSGSAITLFGTILAFGGMAVAFAGGTPNSTWITSGAIDLELSNARLGY